MVVLLWFQLPNLYILYYNVGDRFCNASKTGVPNGQERREDSHNLNAVGERRLGWIFRQGILREKKVKR